MIVFHKMKPNYIQLPKTYGKNLRTKKIKAKELENKISII